MPGQARPSQGRAAIILTPSIHSFIPSPSHADRPFISAAWAKGGALRRRLPGPEPGPRQACLLALVQPKVARAPLTRRPALPELAGPARFQPSCQMACLLACLLRLITDIAGWRRGRAAMLRVMGK